ncbi:helix-turn-helix domain-containing protein [Piscibacillus salipiscarius]|uniref:Helix-turn-helix domain-containing protein n=1 Tax=Piscibacillus salipiscarius TaxID=299480 RepID=A0ABW5Q7B6_9BACI|nr:helix-turn-helix domain-containing protein [Piscibacillus salipiscarius]
MTDRMTAQQTADYLGVCLDTVYRMARKKEIPHYRIRRNVFFSKQSIDNWIKEQEQDNYKNEPQVSSF